MIRLPSVMQLNIIINCYVRADRFATDGDKDGADAALYAADRAQKHCQTEYAMLDAMEAAEAQYDAQKKPGIILLLLESQKPLLTGPKCDGERSSVFQSQRESSVLMASWRRQSLRMSMRPGHDMSLQACMSLLKPWMSCKLLRPSMVLRGSHMPFLLCMQVL